MKKHKDVDSYIAAAPAEARPKLRQLRQIIKKNAPLAQEKLSYGMPYYGYKGRLAYFAAAKKHVGLYIMSPVMKKHEKDVKKYRTGKATLQFPLDKEIPVALVRKLIKTGVRINDSKGK